LVTAQHPVQQLCVKPEIIPNCSLSSLKSENTRHNFKCGHRPRAY